ncbi:MAG: hypothetical protein ACPL7K_00530 [Armatimonadota bacterium]
MSLGLSAKEIEHLDIRQPMLQAICEYARLENHGLDTDERAAGVVNATLKVIDDEIRNLDLEIQMLNLRRRALKKRSRVLEKLGKLLAERGCDLLAA